MRREATCECCRRNDAPEGERLCASCARHGQAAEADRDRYRNALEQIAEGAESNPQYAIAELARAALVDKETA